MENNKTPKPESEDYDVEKPQDLNIPKYNSSTDHRTDADLPAVENLNDTEDGIDRQNSNRAFPDHRESPKPDLGNDRDDDEDEREKIIST